MNEAFIRTCKSYINEGDLAGLQECYSEIQNNALDYSLNWEYIFYRIYLHACLKKKQNIVDWLITLFGTLDKVSQIGLRQIFPYGRYLLAK
jgi:hypothetical protein